MLNISTNSISSKIDKKSLSALELVEAKKTKKVILKVLKWGAILLFLIAMLPWTQNIQSNGLLTTLNPDQRPQKIHSVISGRIEKWKVKEGDFVQKGDTILVVSEIKDAYFDAKLLERTKNQLELKKQSVTSYSGKIKAQDSQLEALITRRTLETSKMKIKMEQTKLKIQNDSIDYQAAILDNKIAIYQYQRMDSLYQKGLKSLADLEKRKIKAQQTSAKEIGAKNKWLNNKNELLNLRVELNNIFAKFESSYAKTTSDKFTTESNKFDTESSVNTLENKYSNYKARKGFNVITAPQDGFITKLLVYGIGETVKAGESILSFMPKNYELAVEMYVDPIDLPLINPGEHVRLQFDGWPAIVFSGWPGSSYGTYGGEIYAIDQFISDNGKYRILVKPDTTDHEWPKDLRVGAGSKTMVLLNDVQVWYELWRKINGFPPEFYKVEATSKTDKK
jgi:adhesin transport system membrane fusion protein